MSTDAQGLARYFDDITERRRATLTESAAKLAEVRVAGDTSAAGIEREMLQAVVAAEAVASKQGEQAAGGWPTQEQDAEQNFLQSLVQPEESAESEHGGWAP